MAVDDHAIGSLRVWYDLEYENLKNEWKTGEYKKLSECPSFEGASSYREAMNVLIKGCYLPEYVESYLIEPLKRQIDEDIKVENYWRE